MLHHCVPLALLFAAVAHVTDARGTSLIPLVELLEHRKVTMTAEGTGGHQGECLRVTITNRTGGTLHTSIPPGWVFVSERDDVQDLLIVREEVLVLAVGAGRTVLCRAFCCEAGGRSPERGDRFRAGRPGADQLVQAARTIAAGNYPDEVVQHGIWVLSDATHIAGMGALDGTATDTLRYSISRISGQPAPRHSLRYADDPDHACSQRPETITRYLAYSVPAGTMLTVVVVDRRGNIRQVVRDRMELTRGVHQLRFELAVLEWPPGDYAIHAWSTDRTGVHRMPFVL